MHYTIGRTRNNILLRQHFDSIGKGLKDAKPSYPVGTITILNPTQALAFEQGGESEKAGKHRDYRNNGEHDGEQRLKLIRGMPHDRFLQVYSYLINRFNHHSG